MKRLCEKIETKIIPTIKESRETIKKHGITPKFELFDTIHHNNKGNKMNLLVVGYSKDKYILIVEKRLTRVGDGTGDMGLHEYQIDVRNWSYGYTEKQCIPFPTPSSGMLSAARPGDTVMCVANQKYLTVKIGDALKVEGQEGLSSALQTKHGFHMKISMKDKKGNQGLYASEHFIVIRRARKNQLKSPCMPLPISGSRKNNQSREIGIKGASLEELFPTSWSGTLKMLGGLFNYLDFKYESVDGEEFKNILIQPPSLIEKEIDEDDEVTKKVYKTKLIDKQI